MGYDLTVGQEELVKRWARQEAKSGERRGCYRIEGDGVLMYRGHENGRPIEELLGLTLNNGATRYAVYNAAQLEYACSQMSWGHRSTVRGGQAHVQEIAEDAGACALPFNALRQAGLDPTEIHIVAKGPSSTITRTEQRRGRTRNGVWQAGKTEDVTRHFVGAILFEVPNGKPDAPEQFLFDIDRREIEHKIFNPFLVRLSKRSTTVEEAYTNLMPDEVRAAIDQGVQVVRQGEWFFIPGELPSEPITPARRKVAETAPCLADFGLPHHDRRPYVGWREYQGAENGAHWGDGVGFEHLGYKPENNAALAEAMRRYAQAQEAHVAARRELEDSDPKEGSLTAKNADGRDSRPNTVESFVIRQGVAWVRGKVQHSGREHQDLVLEGWHRAVPNTAVQSWQITGDID